MKYFHGLGKAGFWMEKDRLPARARVGFGVGRMENPVRACLLKEEGVPGRGEARIMDHGCAALVWPARVRCFGSGRTKNPGHSVLLAQNPCRHVSCAGAHRRELKTPSGKLIESDAACGNLIDGTRNLIDWLGEVPVVHLDDGFPCLLHPVQDLLVLDLQFGISLCLLAYFLPEGVVLP